MNNTAPEVIDSEHLFLFGLLMNSGRVSIRDSNKQVKAWNALKRFGFCTIFESGRSGTLVIHPTAQAASLADSIISTIEMSRLTPLAGMNRGNSGCFQNGNS